MNKLVLLLCLFTCLLSGQAPLAHQTPASPGRTLWRVRMFSLAAANAVDVHSSWGKHETNPLLAGANGSFGSRGSLIKLGLQGSIMGLEYLLTRGHPGRR